MDRKNSRLVFIAMIFVLSDHVSSALININESRELGSLPEKNNFTDYNSITSSRSKRQTALKSSASADVNPPVVVAPLPENPPAIKAAPKPIAPAAMQPPSDFAGAAANAAASGLDAIDQFSQVRNRIRQRLNARLDELQTEADTLASSQVDAITNLVKSGLQTGVMVPTTLFNLLVAKLRFPLIMFG